MKTLSKLTRLIILFLFVNQAHGQCPTLVWSDEFDGSSLDLTKWEPMIGDGCDYGLCGWGNNELQYYKEENAVVSSGTLKLIVKEERVRAKNYTSARLRTKNLADFTFGRFEARVKVPVGQGIWPAFWMLSSNEPYGGWPGSGEIDILEVLGHEPQKTYGTIHYGQPWPDNSSSGEAFVLNNGTFADAFHVFAVEWEPTEIRWYLDDILFSTITSSDVAPSAWPFDASNQMHFLLNVAVGGNWPGSPDASTPFPGQMEVDYVRVYEGYGPSISGNRLVAYQTSGESYTINNTSGGTSYSWSVPADAVITSGQGSNSITVDFGAESGSVSCDVTNSCGTKTYQLDLTVDPNYVFDFSYENFDAAANVVLSSTTGTLAEISNIDPSGVNTSAQVAKYDRNSTELYDLMAYTTSAITDASLYKTRQGKFYMDVYTAAPIGTEILIQLESGAATASNYPTGRHSRYAGTISKNNQWERVEFSYLDAPDASTPDGAVETIIVLFASNSNTSDTYYWDNFDGYKADNGGVVNTPPTVSITSPADGTNYSSISSISVTASAADADGSVAQVEFFANGSSIGVDNTAPYSLNWTLPGDGSYALTAVATDNGAAATSSTSVGITVNTSGGADTQAPTAPSGLTASTTNSSVDLSWSASTDNVGVTGYNIYQDGAFIGTTAALNFTAGGLSISTGYSFDVSAYDAAGNESAFSSISVRTKRKTGTVAAIENEALQAMTIFAEPGNFHVSINPVYENGQVSVVSVSGRTLLNKAINGNSIIDLSHLSKGVYIITLVSEDTLYSQKLFKN